MTRFASQWQANEKFQWAAEYAKSSEYAYRIFWRIPRHDPRLENMTPEEFEFEALTYEQFHRQMNNQPPLAEYVGDWAEGAMRRLREIERAEARQEATQKAQRETEQVDPEEVF